MELADGALAHVGGEDRQMRLLLQARQRLRTSRASAPPPAITTGRCALASISAAASMSASAGAHAVERPEAEIASCATRPTAQRRARAADRPAAAARPGPGRPLPPRRRPDRRSRRRGRRVTMRRVHLAQPLNSAMWSSSWKALRSACGRSTSCTSATIGIARFQGFGQRRHQQRRGGAVLRRDHRDLARIGARSRRPSRRPCSPADRRAGECRWLRRPG